MNLFVKKVYSDCKKNITIKDTSKIKNSNHYSLTRKET